MVRKSTSVKTTPPEVMIALSAPRSPVGWICRSLNILMRASRSSRVTLWQNVSVSIPDFSRITGTNAAGMISVMAFLNFLLLSTAKSFCRASFKVA